MTSLALMALLFLTAYEQIDFFLMETRVCFPLRANLKTQTFIEMNSSTFMSLLLLTAHKQVDSLREILRTQVLLVGLLIPLFFGLGEGDIDLGFRARKDSLDITQLQCYTCLTLCKWTLHQCVCKTYVPTCSCNTKL